MKEYVFKNPYVKETNGDIKRKPIEVRQPSEHYTFVNPYVKRSENDIQDKHEKQVTVEREKLATTEQEKPGKSSNKVKVDNVLPSALYKAIESLQLSRIMREKLIKLSCLILQKSIYKNHDFTVYIPMASKYFEKVFGKDYHNDFFKQAKDTGILECNGVYKQGTKKHPGIPLGYRLNQQLVYGDTVPVSYTMSKNGGSIDKDGGSTNDMICINRDETYKRKDIQNDIQEYLFQKASKFSNSTSTSISSTTSSVSLSSDFKSSYHIIPRFFDKAVVVDDLRSLVYNEKRIWEATQQHITTIGSRLKVNDEVERNYFNVNNTTLKTQYDVSKKSALLWAKDNNVQLIQDGSHFYIKKLDKYIEDKKKSLIASHNWQMTKLKNGIFYAGRNDVNKRLDHNLTCAGKHIMKVIKDDNDLVEIDIMNSQFAIHAYWMKQEGLCSHKDVQKYYELCVGGTLYNSLGKSLDIERHAAKQLMMEIGFSSAGNNSSNKAKFKKEFPNVIAHIDDFKKAKTYKMFSNELQQLEAEIVVDNVYPNIKDLGIFCLTKHDSLIVRKEDQDLVVKIMQSFFKHIKFECTLNIENKVYIGCINE